LAALQQLATIFRTSVTQPSPRVPTPEKKVTKQPPRVSQPDQLTPSPAAHQPRYHTQKGYVGGFYLVERTEVFYSYGATETPHVVGEFVTSAPSITPLSFHRECGMWHRNKLLVRWGFLPSLQIHPLRRYYSSWQILCSEVHGCILNRMKFSSTCALLHKILEVNILAIISASPSRLFGTKNND
jgi:hypothetical protein